MPVRDNVLQFEGDLRAFSAKVDLQLEAVVKKVIFDLLRKTIQRTPVDEGRAAGSWNVARGTPGTDMLPEGAYGRPDATATAKKQMEGVTFDPPEAVYWIYNNLAYIETLEFGLYPSHGKDNKSPSGKTINGFSIQAPSGMVRVSIAEVETDMFEAEAAAE